MNKRQPSKIVIVAFDRIVSMTTSAIAGTEGKAMMLDGYTSQNNTNKYC